MAAKKRSLIGGVDTHRDTHHAAVIDSVGGLLADAEFPANTAGYASEVYSAQTVAYATHLMARSQRLGGVLASLRPLPSTPWVCSPVSLYLPQ